MTPRIVAASETGVASRATRVDPAYVTIATVSSGSRTSRVSRSTTFTRSSLFELLIEPDVSTRKTRLTGLSSCGGGCRPWMPTRSSSVSRKGDGAAASEIEKGASSSAVGAG